MKPVHATVTTAPAVVKRPGRALLYWGLILTTLALSSLAQTEGGWIKLDQPLGGWDWARFVDLVLLGLGIQMVSNYAHRTATWLKGREQ